MFEEFLPKRRIGYLYPLEAIDLMPYQFYRLVPEGVLIVMLPMGGKEFSTKEVERIFTPLDEYLTKMVDRKVDIIVRGGIPLSLLMGLEHHDKILSHIKASTGLPATSNLLNVIAAAKSLGIKNIALANKWNSDMNKTLGLFFEREGIQTAGVNSRPMVPEEFLKTETGTLLTLAYELGRGALRESPKADGLYIGGGSWLTLPIIEPLEREFGKPVITNVSALAWGLCHLLDCWKPIPGYGRLLQSA